MRLQGVLRQMYLEGRQQWPDVRVDACTFEHHCRRVLGPETGVDCINRAADLYLCCACAARNPEALLAFERHCNDVARAAVARTSKDPEFVVETLRELWDKLLFANTAKVAEYSARGPLKAWVRVAAVRTALDRARAERIRNARQIGLSDQLAVEGSGPESALTKARYASTFQQALELAILSLTSQERNLLRMHVLGRCSIDQIGRAYGVHRATAARWLERARAHVLTSVREQVARKHATLTESEFWGIAHLMGTELELSLAASTSIEESRLQPHTAS
jgi:RNA polymerase sigma-70 factor (ECF subfamily)